MRCSPVKTVQNAIRFFFFPVSKYISERTDEIDHRLSELKQQRAVTAEIIQHVEQPDILRSLVISMQEGGGPKHE